MPRSRNSTPELRQLEESICSSAIKLALIAAMASMALVVGRMCPAYAATVNPPLVAPVEECGGYPEFEQDIPSLEPRTSVGTNPVGPSSDSMKSFMLKISKLRISPVSGTARQHEIKSTGRSFQRAFPGSYGQRIQREQGGESAGIDYEQLVKEHADTEQKRGMFTGDAWLGMMRLQRYNELLEKVEEQEKRCFDCTRNRRLLEQVWQTVANEYFDQYGRFSQADWSGELFKTLNGAGGLLQSKPETYKAAKDMVKSLGDPYSSFLIPEEYRLALHRPLPSELKYLAYQYTGVGMEIGKRSPNGGFEIIAPFAGSPAEEVEHIICLIGENHTVSSLS